MSVYIPGMEMPTDCENCIFCDRAACLMHKPNEYRSWAEEYKNCPLIPVPDHGRLIDADEFLNRTFGTGLFDEDYMRLLEELVGGSATVIPADPADKEGE